MKKLLSALLLLMSFAAAANDSAPLWMRYPSISPDGRTIAFTYKGDIYTVPTSGGRALQLTTNPAYDYMPIWSPDGKTIAFASDRYGNFDIFTMPAEGGTPKRITTNSVAEQPRTFTPDGKEILFLAQIMDKANSRQFPYGTLREVYAVSVDGGRPHQVLTIPAEDPSFDKSGKLMAYHDYKGYEDPMRKHHVSPVTRDIWVYDTQAKKHTKISTFGGEDRTPIFGDDSKTLYYLSEQFGDFNVVKTSIDNPTKVEQLTFFKKNPVRFLTKSNSNIFAFGYGGEIYTYKEGGKPEKVAISIVNDQVENTLINNDLTNGASEMSVSPNGKEAAFILRGDVYVASVEYGTTKRITNTPEQERNVSFSPDGRSLVYAGERNGKWQVFTATMVKKDEPFFATSTAVKEESLVTIPEDAFQPSYSPDGKEVAFLKDRTTLSVINLKSKKIRDVLDAKYNYSYQDGDQDYCWSPDSKWFLVKYFEAGGWNKEDIGLVKADGTGTVTNLTNSGYSDSNPKWMMKGQSMIWITDRDGYRSHGSWGSEGDVYGMFFTKKAWDTFKMTKEELDIQKEAEKLTKKDKKDETKKDDAKKDEAKKDSTDKIAPLEIDLNDLESRTTRLTINSSNISDAVLTPDGDKLYYLCSFEKGFDLWVNDLKENSTKLVMKLDGYNGNLVIDKDGKNLFFTSGNTLNKLEISSNKRTTISYKAPKTLDYPAERKYLLDHAYHLVEKKFYDPKLHNVDWNYYHQEYAKFLPYINNNYDFAELLSEMLGELNGSHTGGRYTPAPSSGADQTATLGLIYNDSYSGDGLMVAEVIKKGPFENGKTKVAPGIVITAIDADTIKAGADYYPMLNRKAGKATVVGLLNPKTGQRWEEIVKPISKGTENNLLYDRYVERQEAYVDSISNGRIGYVHVRGMNSESFRETYSKTLGKFRNKEALIVDTRFNGGGWLHNDLAILLSGKKYAEFAPKGQYIAAEPLSQWAKPSVVLASEGNYSDAHGFPFTYKTLKIGKLIGKPVAGTMTAVWWENLQDRTLTIGVPQVGVRDMNGNFLENHTLQPDIEVDFTPEDVANGIDPQLERAVKELLKK
ncbi:S41 family peptidase [uncultured Acetobacteroides sp.]|uniref:S41 family peptidase n=1 Tax=uncultured Acetobacteroides sp. TaxID=1760811 RepID=UPI0029F522B2|nr:S41 family peptidase [uncultured Acetobacteroides sp.]